MRPACVMAVLLAACANKPASPAPTDVVVSGDIAASDLGADAPRDTATDALAKPDDALAKPDDAPDSAPADAPGDASAPTDVTDASAPTDVTDASAPTDITDASAPADVVVAVDAGPPADVVVVDASAPADVAAPGDGGGYMRPPRVTVPPLTPIDFSATPFERTDSGVVLYYTPEGRVEVNTVDATPVTVLGDCTALVAGCYEPGVRSLDACVTSTPTCATATPWTESAPCCPTACIDAFEAARRAGLDSNAAFERVYFDEPDCFPGVRAALRGAP